jgi:branched-chain amino acid transport system permease protein
VLFGLLYTQVNPFVGFIPGVKAFTAAVLGGIGSIPGAMLGGMRARVCWRPLFGTSTCRS